MELRHIVTTCAWSFQSLLPIELTQSHHALSHLIWSYEWLSISLAISDPRSVINCTTDYIYLLGSPNSESTLYQYASLSIASQSFPRSSSSPSISGRVAAAVRSLSLTSPIELHSPTHINARVDCTESRLRRCDNRIRPLLNTRSTLTDVARKELVFQLG